MLCHQACSKKPSFRPVSHSLLYVQKRSREKGPDYLRGWDGEYIILINISKRGRGGGTISYKTILDKRYIFASPNCSENQYILLSLFLFSFSFSPEYEKKLFFAESLSWVMSWKMHVWWWTATNPGNWNSKHTFNQFIVSAHVSKSQSDFCKSYKRWKPRNVSWVWRKW